MKRDKINTVNVVKVNKNNRFDVGIYAFADNREGNEKAEKLFKKMIREYDRSYKDKYILIDIENGYYEENKYWILLLNHSV